MLQHGDRVARGVSKELRRVPTVRTQVDPEAGRHASRGPMLQIQRLGQSQVHVPRKYSTRSQTWDDVCSGVFVLVLCAKFCRWLH